MSPLLACTKLNKRFGGLQAVCDVSFGIERGSIVSLVGPNGAGKTTLFDIIGGYALPDSGKVALDGTDLTRMPPHRRARLGIGRTFQEQRIIRRLSVLENVLLASSLPCQESLISCLVRPAGTCHAQQAAALEWLHSVDLAEHAQCLVANLSYGQEKLLTVACCLASGDRLLLLDEPFAGLSHTMMDRLIALLRTLRQDYQKTVFLIEHNMDAVACVSDRVLVMNGGTIIADDAPVAIRRCAAVVEAYTS